MLRVAMVCLLACLLTTATSIEGTPRFNSPNLPQIRSISLAAREGPGMELVVKGDGSFQSKIFELKSPSRLVIDISPAILNVPIHGTLSVSHAFVSSFRSAQFSPGIVRVVLDLKQPIAYQVIPAGKDLRIWIGEVDFEMNLVTQNLSAFSSEDHLAKNKKVKAKRDRSSSAGWSMFGSFSDEFARNIWINKERINSMGNVYGVGFRYRNAASHPSFKLQYSIAGHEYAEVAGLERVSQDFQMSYQRQLEKKLTLTTTGQMSLNGSMEDDETADQYVFKPEITYRLDRKNYVGVYGGYRMRILHLASSRTDLGRFYGLEYGHKFGNQILELGYRYDVNDSEKPKYDFARWTYNASYQIPWGKRTGTFLEAEYAPRQYSNRLIHNASLPAGSEVERFDRRFSFSVVTYLTLAHDLELLPAYLFEASTSNDPYSGSYTLHLPSLALRYRW